VAAVESIHNTSQADKEKQTVALSSVGAAVLLTTIKIVVGVMTGSLGILSEAAHSGLDLVAAAVTYFAVRISGKPPDSRHTYGYGKVENLSALFETFLLLITCIWIIYEALARLFFLAGRKSKQPRAVIMIVSIGGCHPVAPVEAAKVQQPGVSDALHFHRYLAFRRHGGWCGQPVRRRPALVGQPMPYSPGWGRHRHLRQHQLNAKQFMICDAVRPACATRLVQRSRRKQCAACRCRPRAFADRDTRISRSSRRNRCPGAEPNKSCLA
jgi:hypothetical protein